jgi:hypothetical protein
MGLGLKRPNIDNRAVFAPLDRIHAVSYRTTKQRMKPLTLTSVGRSLRGPRARALYVQDQADFPADFD